MRHLRQIALALILASTAAYAQPITVNVNGSLYMPDGQPVPASALKPATVNVRLSAPVQVPKSDGSGTLIWVSQFANDFTVTDSTSVSFAMVPNSCVDCTVNPTSTYYNVRISHKGDATHPGGSFNQTWSVPCTGAPNCTAVALGAVPINDVVDPTIDALAATGDTASGRITFGATYVLSPQAQPTGPVTGQFYVSTDIPAKYYLYTGTSWVEQGPGSGLDTGEILAGTGISVGTEGGSVRVTNTGVVTVTAGASVALQGTATNPIVSVDSSAITPSYSNLQGGLANGIATQISGTSSAPQVNVDSGAITPTWANVQSKPNVVEGIDAGVAIQIGGTSPRPNVSVDSGAITPTYTNVQGRPANTVESIGAGVATGVGGTSSIPIVNVDSSAITPTWTNVQGSMTGDLAGTSANVTVDDIEGTAVLYHGGPNDTGSTSPGPWRAGMALIASERFGSIALEPTYPVTVRNAGTDVARGYVLNFTAPVGVADAGNGVIDITTIQGVDAGVAVQIGGTSSRPNVSVDSGAITPTWANTQGKPNVVEMVGAGVATQIGGTSSTPVVSVDSAAITPTFANTQGAMTGDLTGTSASVTVSKIEGVEVAYHGGPNDDGDIETRPLATGMVHVYSERLGSPQWEPTYPVTVSANQVSGQAVASIDVTSRHAGISIAGGVATVSITPTTYLVNGIVSGQADHVSVSAGHMDSAGIFVIDAGAAGGTFSGDIDSATNKQLSNSGAQTGGAVGVVDDAGLTVMNASGPSNQAMTIDGYALDAAGEHIAVLDPLGVTGPVSITAGTPGSGVPALTLSGTLNAGAAIQYGSNWQITSPANGPTEIHGLNLDLLAGSLTSAIDTNAFRIINSVKGTATSSWSAGSSNKGGTIGSRGDPTAGHNVGLVADATGSSALNAGVMAFGGHNGTSTGTSIGVFGNGDALGGVGVGGFFVIQNSDTPNSPAPATEAALIADNRDVAADIIVGRDSGTKVFTVVDGGAVSLAPGTPANAIPALALTSTLNAGAATQYGVNLQVSSPAAVSGPTAIYVLNIDFLAGSLTSAIDTNAYRAVNAVAGTGALSWIGSDHNKGATCAARSTTVGHNTGVVGDAFGSSTSNKGVLATAGFYGASTGDSIGVVGHSDGSAGVAVGVLAMIQNNDIPSAPTALTEAALLADNRDLASNIVTLRDNGTIVGEIEDGGIVDLAPGGVRAIYADTDNVTVRAGSIDLDKSVTGRIYSVGNRSQVITGDSTAIEDLFTETITLPANYLRAGRTLRYHFFGTYDAAAATAATWRMNLGGTDVAVTDAITVLNSAGNSWTIDGTVSVEAAGAAGVVNAVITVHAESTTLDSTNTEMQSTVINTTASQAMTPSIQFDGSSASNGAVIYGGYIEALN